MYIVIIWIKINKKIWGAYSELIGTHNVKFVSMPIFLTYKCVSSVLHFILFCYLWCSSPFCWCEQIWKLVVMIISEMGGVNQNVIIQWNMIIQCGCEIWMGVIIQWIGRGYWDSSTVSVSSQEIWQTDWGKFVLKIQKRQLDNTLTYISSSSPVHFIDDVMLHLTR